MFHLLFPIKLCERTWFIRRKWGLKCTPFFADRPEPVRTPTRFFKATKKKGAAAGVVSSSLKVRLLDKSVAQLKYYVLVFFIY